MAVVGIPTLDGRMRQQSSNELEFPGAVQGAVG